MCVTQHVASNSFTRYRPYPSPAQFAASTELISRTTTFLRRELQIWDDLDVEVNLGLVSWLALRLTVPPLPALSFLPRSSFR